DLGRGGVDATWTLVTPPTSTSFVATPDDVRHSLRLTGPASSPRSFTVEASAVDEIGATLATTKSTVVVAAPLSDAGATQGDAPAPFGFFFDAIAGSRASIAVRFSDSDAPRFMTIVDDRGAPLTVPGRALRQGDAGVKIDDILVPRTTRVFVVFR